MNFSIWKNDKHIRLSLLFLLLFFSLIFLFLIISFNKKQYKHASVKKYAKITPLPSVTNRPIPTPTISPTPLVLPSKVPSSPVQTLNNNNSGKILFGIGSQAGPAMDFRIVKEAPVHMLTSWYNGSKDLEWMRVQQNDLIPRLYANHYVVHLITWTDLPEVDIQTPYGPACGRPYPVSKDVVEDMKQLAQIYNGDGPMYVSLFTEFQTYTCVDNNWIGNENYFNTLKDNYRLIKDAFHQYAPQAKVSISWGGWQSRYDDQENQGGLSLFPHFSDILNDSDFSSFQSMESDSNVQEILDMTRILGSYKKPVMLSHYKPSNGSEDVFNNDMRSLFSDEIMSKLISNGLFAFSFMDDELLDNSDISYNLVKNGIQKYGK